MRGLLFIALGLCAVPLHAASHPQPQLVSVKKIWDAAPHNAFTGLTSWRGDLICVFREGQRHVSDDGAVRVIRSADGETWQSAALIQLAGFDLRDPKICVAPDQRLMIVGGATVREGNQAATGSQSFVTFSKDGESWSKLQWVGPTNQWLWRVTWHDSAAYGVAYDVTPDRRNERSYATSLLKSTNGVQFDTVVPALYTNSGPTEATIRFDDDGTAYCLQRRDGRPSNTALIGTSQPPYREWQWQDLGKYFGGPDFIKIPDGRWIAAGRLFNAGSPPGTRTALCELNPRNAQLHTLLLLPSNGDSSYPGLVWQNGFLWMSYYSSHEGKTSIYLAKLKL